MTKQEAIRFVIGCGEDEGPKSDAEAAEIFTALYGRAPDVDDEEVGVWDLCCAAV